MSSGSSRFKRRPKGASKGSTGNVRARRHLLDYHREQIIRDLRVDGRPDSVYLLVDVSTRYGKILSKAHLGEEGHDWFVNDCISKKAIPTLHIIASWEMVEKLLPMTSPTAAETLAMLKTGLSQASGQRLAVAIGDGGNSYETVTIDGSQPVKTLYVVM